MNCSCTILGTGIETIERVKSIAKEAGACAVMALMYLHYGK